MPPSELRLRSHCVFMEAIDMQSVANGGEKLPVIRAASATVMTDIKSEAVDPSCRNPSKQTQGTRRALVAVEDNADSTWLALIELQW
jgi:hypothetical protein